MDSTKKEGCPGIDSEERGKASACEGCPNQKLCQSGQIQKDPTIDLVKEKLSTVKNIILVLSGKGGVGKSTTSINLAACLAEKNKKVLVIDSDPQGNTTSGFGIDKNFLENTIY